MTRVACLIVPCFPLAARLRVEPELAGQAVVVCEGDGAAARVAAVSRISWRFGLRPGSTLAQARSRMPDIIARGRDAVAERSAHEALLEAAATLSPRVEDARENIVYADVSGMESLFPGDGGEAEIGRTAMLVAEGLSLVVQAGIAGTKLAARIAAFKTPSPTVVPLGHEAAFMASLPVTDLGLSRRLWETLQRWGVTTVGDLARLPADRVAARLGADGQAAHRAACGHDPEPLSPHHPAPVLSEGLELEWAVVTVDPLLALLRPCLERMHRRLEQQDLACTLLELELELEPEGIDRRPVRLPAPARDVEALLILVRLEIEARPPRGPVAAFRCLVHPDRPRTGQLTLFGPPEIHPDRLAVTLARLAARLGPDRVGSPRLVDGHLPERAATALFDPPPPPKRRLAPRRGRGLLAVRVLRPPVLLEVIVESRQHPKPVEPEEAEEMADGRPVSVASENGATPRIQGLVRVAAGPWSLEEGWWKDEPVARDYWDVELSGGGLYRIFRDRVSAEWYADGIYD